MDSPEIGSGKSANVRAAKEAVVCWVHKCERSTTDDCVLCCAQVGRAKFGRKISAVPHRSFVGGGSCILMQSFRAQRTSGGYWLSVLLSRSVRCDEVSDLTSCRQPLWRGKEQQFRHGLEKPVFINLADYQLTCGTPRDGKLMSAARRSHLSLANTCSGDNPTPQL